MKSPAVIEEAPLPTRRQVGGYIWQDELEAIAGHSERVAQELSEMSQSASTVEATRRLAKLATLNMQLSVRAMRLMSYKAKE